MKEGEDENGEGIEEVGIKETDRERFGRGRGEITILKKGEDGHATSLTPLCDLAPLRCITRAQRTMKDSMD